jgi:hypothetical protein
MLRDFEQTTPALRAFPSLLRKGTVDEPHYCAQRREN